MLASVVCVVCVACVAGDAGDAGGAGDVGVAGIVGWRGCCGWFGGDKMVPPGIGRNNCGRTFSIQTYISHHLASLERDPRHTQYTTIYHMHIYMVGRNFELYDFPSFCALVIFTVPRFSQLLRAL